MKQVRRLLRYFTLTEKLLWLFSTVMILFAFFIGEDTSVLSMIASLIGVTSLIFCAKGHPVGQVLIIVFSSIYGIISYRFAYYGEMLTYVGMTLPMAVLALVSWLKTPFEKGKAEVRINPRLHAWEYLLLPLFTAAVTVIFYFLLKAFGTANIIPSTVSITTSFLAVYLTFRRNPYYALAYAANDIVLIVLWVLAAMKDARYLSMLFCFVAFLANDVYGFINWQKLSRKQKNGKIKKTPRQERS